MAPKGWLAILLLHLHLHDIKGELSTQCTVLWNVRLLDQTVFLITNSDILLHMLYALK